MTFCWLTTSTRSRRTPPAPTTSACSCAAWSRTTRGNSNQRIAIAAADRHLQLQAPRGVCCLSEFGPLVVRCIAFWRLVRAVDCLDSGLFQTVDSRTPLRVSLDSRAKLQQHSCMKARRSARCRRDAKRRAARAPRKTRANVVDAPQLEIAQILLRAKIMLLESATRISLESCCTCVLGMRRESGLSAILEMK